MVRSGANGTGTLVDILTLRVVGSGAGTSSSSYGSQRLWTAVAWGVGSLLAGHLIDRWGFDAIWYWNREKQVGDSGGTPEPPGHLG